MMISEILCLPTCFSTMMLIISRACTSIVINAPRMFRVNFGITPRTIAASLLRLLNDVCSKCRIASRRSPSVVKQAVTSPHHIVCETVNTTCDIRKGEEHKQNDSNLINPLLAFITQKQFANC